MRAAFQERELKCGQMEEAATQSFIHLTIHPLERMKMASYQDLVERETTGNSPMEPMMCDQSLVEAIAITQCYSLAVSRTNSIEVVVNHWEHIGLARNGETQGVLHISTQAHM